MRRGIAEVLGISAKSGSYTLVGYNVGQEVGQTQCVHARLLRFLRRAFVAQRGSHTLVGCQVRQTQYAHARLLHFVWASMCTTRQYEHAVDMPSSANAMHACKAIANGAGPYVHNAAVTRWWDASKANTLHARLLHLV